jgi:small GTP-binding protein
MLQIAAFGKISVGKSALLNAVFGVDVFTVDVRGGSTTQVHEHQVRFGDWTVVVVDTPGIAEVGGSDRGEQARLSAQNAHLVLVVLDHDLTEMEMREINALAEYGKPMLAVLNKADSFREKERHNLLVHLRGRLSNCVEPENVFVCAAAPVRRFVRSDAHGNSEEWEGQGAPEIENLRQRLMHVLKHEAGLLKQLHTFNDNLTREQERIARAKTEADPLIDRYALGVAVGVAVNPIPLVDLFGGGTALAVLVGQLADCHAVRLTSTEVASLSARLFTEGWGLLWPSLVPIIGGAMLKSIPFIGHLAGASLQGAGAYYIVRVLGGAVSDYFEHGQHSSLRASLEQIIARTDRQSVMRTAQERIKEKLTKKR